MRLRFDEPHRVCRIWLHFFEPAVARTQEFVLRWATADEQPAREVVRQQWTFSPGGSIHEFEDYRIDLLGVVVLELTIIPDISGGDARISNGTAMRSRYRVMTSCYQEQGRKRQFTTFLLDDQ